MLTNEEKEKLNKKMSALRIKMVDERDDFIKRKKLNKEGDENWRKYVRRTLTWFDRYQRFEYRATRTMYVRELINRRKGKKSPIINI